MRQAVVLLGRGGYGLWPREELERMAAAVRAAGRYRPVETAYVDQGAPTLPQALRRCATAGAERILVAPVFVPVDRSLRLWLPQILRRWLRRAAARGIEVVLADPLGDRPALGAAALEAVAAAAAGGGKVEIRPELGLEYANPGWSAIPAHRYHALVCTGPRCATRGSLELCQQLRDALAERGLLSGKDRVSLVRTGCLYPCNLGPVMVVYPDGAWYCSLTPAMIGRILEEHFVGGRAVERYTRRPGSRRNTRPAPADPRDVVEDEPVALRPPRRAAPRGSSRPA